MKNEVEIEMIPSIGKDGLFHRAYTLSNQLTPNGRIFLGTKENRTCRFCGKGDGQTSFRMKAHIVPEFMGNKHYFSYFECDLCNQYFSKLEDSLYNYAGILNTLSTLKGKRGYSKFKDRGSEVFARNEKEVVNRINDKEKGDIFWYDEKAKRMHVETYKPSYVPQDAFKALVKIALCMMSDEELRKYSYTIQWLMSPNTEKHQHNPFFNIFKKIGGEKRFLNPIAFLFKKRDSSEFDRFPSHVLLLWYGIISYQVFIPFNSDNFHFATLKKLVFPLEEHILLKKYEDGVLSEIGIDRDQLSGTKKTRKKKDKFSFGFRMNPDFIGFEEE